MGKFFRMLENVFAAAAFAECGDWDTARNIARGDRPSGRTSKHRSSPAPRPRVRA